MGSGNYGICRKKKTGEEGNEKLKSGRETSKKAKKKASERRTTS
jgi:hypothetical protein